MDLQAELVDVHDRGQVRQVIPDEESVDGREHAFIEDVEGRLELWRASREPDEGAFLRIFNEGPLAVVERQRDHFFRQSSPGRT